jgi:succinoglycan biosynthesis protein ExoA
MLRDGKPFVSIVMPALNEERHIATAIASVVPQSDSLDYELIVVDGGSTDRTRTIIAEIAQSNGRIRLIANTKRIQSAGVNLAAKLAAPHSSILVRADCHLHYPEGFVERCLDTLTGRQVASVVVPMRTEGTTCMQKAIAAAQNSVLGNGGSAHRLPGWSGYVEHGHHAAFDRKSFLELGGYDEDFLFNEDAEFDRRLIKAGKRIYLDSGAAVTYYPRDNLKSLIRQYFCYGWGRAAMLLKHRAVPRVRQTLPVAVFVVCLMSAVLAAWDPRYLAVPAAYLLACLVWGAALSIRLREPCALLSGLAAIVMHMGWAVGFMARLCKFRPRAAQVPILRPSSE